MQRTERRLNIAYGTNQGSYWMIYGVIYSFVSVFLLARGYTNTEIGIILAVSNIVAMLLQPFAADLADHLKKISVLALTAIFGFVLLVFTLGLKLFPNYGLALSLFYIAALAWLTMLQPLVNSLNFKLQDCGAYVDFGICRSGGSLGYAVLVIILGIMIEKYGVGIVPDGAVAMAVLFLLSLLFTGKSYRDVQKKFPSISKMQSQTSGKQYADISLWEFIKGNSLFILLHIGVFGIFFGHSVQSSYMAQIITSVGGNSADLGRILGISAVIEIPTLIFFGFLMRRFSCRLLLKIAAVAFTVKIFLICLSNSTALIYGAQFFQMLAYAVFLPAMVYFIDSVMLPGEAVKGQAFFVMTTTASTVFAGLCGGVVLDTLGVKPLLMISLGVSAVGTVIILLIVNRIKQKKQD